MGRALRRTARIFTSLLVGAWGTFIATSAYAAGTYGNFAPPPNGVTPPAPLNNVAQVSSLFDAVIGWLFWALILFSIIMFLVGGYRYVTSSGDPEKVKNANKTLLYAAIAVVVAIVAAGIPSLIQSFFIPSYTFSY